MVQDQSYQEEKLRTPIEDQPIPVIPEHVPENSNLNINKMFKQFNEGKMDHEMVNQNTETQETWNEDQSHLPYKDNEDARRMQIRMAQRPHVNRVQNRP